VHIPAYPDGESKIRKGVSYTLEVRTDPIFVMCAMIKRDDWQNHLRKVTRKRVYGFIESRYHGAMVNSGRKCAYLTSQCVDISEAL